MLAHILALTVGLLSFALYMSAFFFPEVYRKSDLAWSGIGLFYALVLWVCAGRITGGVLLGQTASVALLGWLGWQTINLRRELAPIALRTPLPSEAKTIGQATQFKLGELKSRWQQTKISEQTNRLAATIAGWTSSIAKPKKQPPSVGSRSRQPKKKIAPTSIAPVAINESMVAEASVSEISGSETSGSEAIAAAPVTDDAMVDEATSRDAAAIATPPARTARSRNPFDKLRRNAGKAETTQKRIPPAPSPSLDDLDMEDWDEEETIAPVIVEPEASPSEEVVVVIVDAPIEAGEATEAEAALVVEVIEVIEVIEVEAIEPMSVNETAATDADTNWVDEPPTEAMMAIEVESDSAPEPFPAESSPAEASESPVDQS